MATLTAWKFDTADGAAKAEATLQELATADLITIFDAAEVSWQPGKKKPKTRQLSGLTGEGALTGSFWGLLFGLIFFVPLIGMAVGAAMGALTGSLVDAGIDDDFIKAVRSEVTPGTSALFVLSGNAVIDKVSAAFAGANGHLVTTNLSNEEEAKLRAAFGQDD